MTRMPNVSRSAWGILQKQPALEVGVRALYSFVRLITPTRSNQIAFVSHPDCSDNAYALFEYIMQSPRVREYRLVWLATDTEAAKKTLYRDYPELDPDHVRVVRKNSLRGLYWYLRSRYVFFTHGVYNFVRSGMHQVLVNLWHGMPIKSLGVHDPRVTSKASFSHYVVGTSAFYASQMAEVFEVPGERALVSGLPRNQWLFQPDRRHSSIRDGRARLIVWVPTYRQWNCGQRDWSDVAANARDPITTASLARLDRLLDGANVLVLLKLHPGDARNGRAWPVFRNIRMYPHQEFQREGLNVYKLLACSDGLITDYSSIAVDYLLLRKPVGFFVPDACDYTRGFMPEVWDRLAAAGPQLKSLEELAEFIRGPLVTLPRLQEIEDLHRGDLRNPSAAILRAVGLERVVHTRVEAVSVGEWCPLTDSE